MKRFKFPLLALAVAMVLGTAVAATLPTAEVVKTTVYHYTSDDNSIDALRDMDNWLGEEEVEGCGIFGTVPCTFTYSGPDFQTYLNGKNASQIIAEADSRREP